MTGCRFDFHIHTTHLRCANETMQVAAIVERCATLGATKIGIADHLNSLDTLPLHRRIRADIEALEADLEVYFGVELNFVGPDGAFAYDEAVRDELGFQFAIGGIHATYLDTYDIGQLVAIQHRHHLKTCEDPLVQVLVHPYWFSKGEFERKGFPWFDTMRHVSGPMARELGAAARQTDTAIEINACANLRCAAFPASYVEEYMDFLSVLASEGARFSLASDAHDIDRLDTIESVWAATERLGLTEDRIWRPRGAPMAGTSAGRAPRTGADDRRR